MPAKAGIQVNVASGFDTPRLVAGQSNRVSERQCFQ